jgi:pSer/pThr/pTyr-binding forkhead associated (FHA) protein
MTRENNQVVVRDLGNTNGIRINGMRVETGRLKPVMRCRLLTSATMP